MFRKKSGEGNQTWRTWTRVSGESKVLLELHMLSELSESSTSETFRQPCKDPTMANGAGSISHFDVDSANCHFCLANLSGQLLSFVPWTKLQSQYQLVDVHHQTQNGTQEDSNTVPWRIVGGRVLLHGGGVPSILARCRQDARHYHARYPNRDCRGRRAWRSRDQGHVSGADAEALYVYLKLIVVKTWGRTDIVLQSGRTRSPSIGPSY